MKDGNRLRSFSGPHSTVLTIDWDIEANTPVQTDFGKARPDETDALTMERCRPRGAVAFSGARRFMPPSKPYTQDVP